MAKNIHVSDHADLSQKTASTRLELQNLIRDYSIEAVTDMLNRGELHYPDRYEISQDPVNGFLQAGFTEDYRSQLMEMSNHVPGALDRMDELVSQGFTEHIGTDYEYLDFRNNLAKNGELESISIESYENPETHEIIQFLHSGSEYIGKTLDEARALDQHFAATHDEKTKYGVEMAKAADIRPGVAITIAGSMSALPEQSPSEFVQALKADIREMEKEIAGSSMWDKNRMGEGKLSRDLSDIMRLGSAAERTEALEELFDGKETLENALPDTNSLRDVKAFYGAVMDVMNQDLEEITGDIDTYRAWRDELPHGNAERVMNLAGEENRALNLILCKGTVEDMQKYLTVTIPSDRVRTEEELKKDGYLYRECPEERARMIMEEGRKALEAGADLSALDLSRKQLTSTLGSIEHAGGLNQAEKDALSRAYLQSVYAGEKENRYINSLFHTGIENKYERIMGMIGHSEEEQKKSLGEALKEMAVTTINSILSDERFQSVTDFLHETESRFKAANLGTHIHFHAAGEREGTMELTFRNLGNFVVELTGDIVEKLNEMDRNMAERAEKWLDRITGNGGPVVQNPEENREGMTDHYKGHTEPGNHQEVTITHDTVFDNASGSRGASVHQNDEQVVDYNARVSAENLIHKMGENLHSYDQDHTEAFTYQGVDYDVMPVVEMNEDNKTLDFTGVIAFMHGDNPANLEDFTYVEIGGMKEKSMEERGVIAESILPESCDSVLTRSMDRNEAYTGTIHIPIIERIEGEEFLIKPEAHITMHPIEITVNTADGEITLRSENIEPAVYGVSEKIAELNATEERTAGLLSGEHFASDLVNIVREEGYTNFNVSVLTEALHQATIDREDRAETGQMVGMINSLLSEAGYGDHAFSNQILRYEGSLPEHQRNRSLLEIAEVENPEDHIREEMREEELELSDSDSYPVIGDDEPAVKTHNLDDNEWDIMH